MFGNLLAKWTGAGGGKEAAKPTFRHPADLDQLLGEDVAILFKHSTSCPVSWAAHSQISQFMRNHPSAPVYLISVTKERAFSQKVAATTGVRHESPQVIVLRRGELVGSASHGAITADALTEMVTSR